MSERRQLPRLVALTPGTLRAAEVAAFVPRVVAALEAGLEAVLLREPGLADGAWLELARTLRARGGRTLWLGAHDRGHLAAAVEADALHLGFRSLSPAAARRAFPAAGRALGLSTHAGDAPPAGGTGALDYLFHGPVRDTPSKHGWKEPLGFEPLAAFTSASALPVYAIGGMRPTDVGAALGAGAYGVAVLVGLLGAPDPAAAVRAYREAFEAATV